MACKSHIGEPSQGLDSYHYGMDQATAKHIVEFIAKESKDGRDWVPVRDVLSRIAGEAVSPVLESVLLEHNAKHQLRLSNTGAFYAKSVLNLQWVEDNAGTGTQRRDPDCLTLVRETRYLQGMWTEIHDKGHLIASRRFMEMEDHFVMLLHLAVRMAMEEGFTENEIN